MLPKINPTHTTAWQKLTSHFDRNDFDLRELFNNTNRFNEFSIKKENFLFDYSKISLTKKPSNYSSI